MKPFLSLILIHLFIINMAAAQKAELRVRFRSESMISKKPVNAKENLLPYTASLDKFQQEYGLVKLRASFHWSRSERFRRTYRLEFSSKEKTAELIKILTALPGVELAEEITPIRIGWEPNDIGDNSTNTTGQWGLHTIEAERAWDIHRGSTSVVVAVVDNGVLLSHPDLVNKWTAGYDVSDDDNDPDIPSSTFRHGTHVAGIIGAETNNGVGVSSIGNRIRVMPIKAQADDGDPDFIADGYEGILWAAENGADVINCSFGGAGFSSSEQDVINEATNDYGALVVAAAGNDNVSTRHYPAAYTNVLSVASTAFGDVRSGFSNFGSWVDICAPGTSIRSTVPVAGLTGGYANMNGTSMAAPMVAGVCGLVKSCSLSYTPSQITAIVKNSANTIIYANEPSFNGLLGTGRLDAYSALAAASVCRSDETITGNFIRALTESSNWIQSSGTTNINAGEQVILDAATEVILKPGFSAVYGTVFRADIEGCGDGPPDGATRVANQQGKQKK